jgi:catechol 2,3-dioxygenase-like lactoylglutathione lyase family enzyme
MPEPAHLAIPILHVTDLNAAIAFYTGVLGFEEDFRYEDLYGGLRTGNVHLHLRQGEGPFSRPVGGANVYFYLASPADIDAYHAAIVANGARVDHEPQDWPYGMRDFATFDPDGNVLAFGAETGA